MRGANWKVVARMEHGTEPGPAEWPGADAGSAADPAPVEADPPEAAGSQAAGPEATRSEAVPSSAPGTGEPRVDAALKLLDRLPGLPVSQHPELFEQVHAQLTEVLGELDSGPDGPAGPSRN
jgi:hypothetical protein